MNELITCIGGPADRIGVHDHGNWIKFPERIGQFYRSSQYKKKRFVHGSGGTQREFYVFDGMDEREAAKVAAACCRELERLKR